MYSLIDRRLKEGLGWPDRAYNNSVSTQALSVSGAASLADGSSDGVVLDKLVRHEPLLPGRRTLAQLPSQQTSPANSQGRRLSRERSNYAFDEQVYLRTSTNGPNITSGLTQEALNELVPASKLASKRSFHDIIIRKPSGTLGYGDQNDEPLSPRRVQNSNGLAPIKPLLIAQRGNTVTPQQQHHSHHMKPRSLPNSTLDHANQNGFHLPHDPLATNGHNTRTPKNLSRTSQVEPVRKPQQNPPTRYNPSKSYSSTFPSPWRHRSIICFVSMLIWHMSFCTCLHIYQTRCFSHTSLCLFSLHRSLI